MTHNKPKKGHPWLKPWVKKSRRKPAQTRMLATRKVFVTLEIVTHAPLSDLRKAAFWSFPGRTCLQAQANVARQEPRDEARGASAARRGSVERNVAKESK